MDLNHIQNRNGCDDGYEFLSCWNYVPDSILLHIFQYLTPKELLNVGLTCQTWNRVSYDELLWKHLLYRNFKIDPSIPIPPGKISWYEEYKRLVYNTPIVCSEVLCEHGHQVLHVSCSHDGTMFATSSKDGYIIVWTTKFPARVKYSHDMKTFSWKYTQFSQFNQSDTLLLVSGVHFGTPNSTSGEIAVFSLQDGFQLQCRVGNKPYDIFGTWYSNQHLLSGDLHWLAHLVSATGVWINKASQETASEHTPILNQLFRFYNTNASSVRAVMVADCQAEDVSAENSDCGEDEDLAEQPEKLLIFTTGSKTYTPHQIGFKRIRGVKFPTVIDPGPSLKERIAQRDRQRAGSMSLQGPDWLNYQAVASKFDKIDHIIDLHGHIIGMGLSPDHRYLYVNSRPWPDGYKITNPLDPPPIAQEIDIHVIDLAKFQEVGKMLRSHKAYTPNNECFFIFLDVSHEYVASGAEDKHGYLWDRHYGICLAKLPHSDVVNSVAFNPVDPGMLITTSDDYLVKIWRSRAFMESVVGKEQTDNLPWAITSLQSKGSFK
ncbi:hypothetical protein AAG570_001007 [Ranatra chinensis]|uniref:F-box domain-containing protein n=1 Tax=Ranatra chinensis TaxID=642074 RepID=A0ABD0YT60_9HEMI